MGRDKYEGVFKNEDGLSYAFKPDTGKYVPVNDRREEWKQDAKECPTTKDERQNFYQQRIQLIESSEGRDELRYQLLENLNQSVKAEDAEPGDLPEPVPGGVGYGAYYKPGMLRFAESSTLQYKIIAVEQVGNDLNQWLYLTSTNRAPRGVEAYVAYRRQDPPLFKVFDWSKSGADRFALSRPYDKLADYLMIHTEDEVDYRILEVKNTTRRIGENRWTNEVMVFNSSTNNYDLVYSHEYDLPASEQTKFLWWGPIVETFHPFPFPTNKLGFFDAQLVQDEAGPVLLTPAVTDLKGNHGPPTINFERKHFSFVVHW